MRILVDADACPVKKEIVQVAKKYKVEVFMFMDTAHSYSDGYSETITVDQGNDSVDIRLINACQPNDIVVTQDYGLAALALAKRTQAINQNGRLYTSENIDQLLFERHLGVKNRQTRHRQKGMPKRTKEDDQLFILNFERLFINE